VWKDVLEACQCGIKQAEKVMPNKKDECSVRSGLCGLSAALFDLKERFGEMAGLA